MSESQSQSHPILDIPPSSSTVSVHLLTVSVATVEAHVFMRPVAPNYPEFHCPCFSFLIEHPSNYAGEKKVDRLMFDLGFRKDLENSVPALKARLQDHIVVTEKDPAEQLIEAGVALSSIDAIIWSHTHADHTGDPTKFPPSTALVVGPGTQANFFPPYPENLDGLFPQSFFENRQLREIASDEFPITIGGFGAHDYFGDGSLYLLDVPGHAPSHMAALARTTPSPHATFVLLGADTCHHPAHLRPSSGIKRLIPCPAALLSNVSPTHIHYNASYPANGDRPIDAGQRAEPLLTIPPQGAPSVHTCADVALHSIHKVAEQFDAHPDVFVVISHDWSPLGIVDEFPHGTLDKWKEERWKEKCAWVWLEEGHRGFRFK